MKLFVSAFAAAALAIGITTPVAAQDLGQSCTNPQAGYTVGYPTGWFANEHTPGPAAGQDVAACRYFAPEAFTIEPGTEPTDVSIGIGLENVAFDATAGEQVTVGGRQAVRMEEVAGEQALFPEGTRTYLYRVDMGGGQTLAARTVEVWVGDYEENRQVLDAMMASLTFAEAEAVPDVAAEAPAGGLNPAFVLGLVWLLGLSVLGFRIRTR